MKHFCNLFLILLLLSSVINVAYAIPADPTPRKVMQPDGTYLTIVARGDEFMHYRTTEDGYTVLRNAIGYYVFATTTNGKIIPSDIIAKDVVRRTEKEISFLKNTPKYLKNSSATTATKVSIERNKWYQHESILKKTGMASKDFHGIIILAEFTDRKFLLDDINSQITNMINQKGYSEDNATGSVRDYFYDNSMGKFEPQFDIIGPVTLDYKQTDAKGSDNGQQLVRNACIKADELADFSKYDLDKDGEVDMVYVIFAGAGSNTVGNNENYIWPHAHKLYNSRVKLDGVYCNRYACSTELAGSESSKTRDGIGTICHEFSHVLGLPDFYDTDYEENGTAPNPSSWSLMAHGSYLNNSHTPCAYSLFERYAIGWATPELISQGGEYTIKPLSTSNQGYRINSATDKEFFILENRQKNGWDKYLPGHGMLVFRVDSTNANVWIGNTINCNPDHTYYELLRANNRTTDDGGNPFPGTSSVRNLTNSTRPSIKSWNGSDTDITLSNISESNSDISFIANKENSQAEIIEDFETLAITTDDATGLQGKFSKWDLIKARVQSPGSSYADGEKSIGFYTGSSLISTSPINDLITSVSYKIWNTLSSSITTRLYYSYDNGTSWRTAYNSSSSALVSVDAKSSTTVNFEINAEEPTVYKITMSTGNSTQMCYIDNFTMKYNSSLGISSVNRDKESLKAFYIGNILTIESKDNDSFIEIYSLTGILAKRQKPENGCLKLNLPDKGIYIIRQNGKSIKIMN